MPPWPADPDGSVTFRNDTRLSQEDIHTLVAWVDSGAAKGDESDLPALPFAQGWRHPHGVPPDAVIFLPEFEVPAEGEVPYVTHLVKVPFAEDKWITAIQVRPGNGAVVHHMAITEVRAEERFGPDVSPLAALARQVGFENDLIPREPVVTAPWDRAMYDMLGVYTPGASFEMYGDGAAKLLKGGKDFYLNFNIHYQTTGRPEKDQSRLAPLVSAAAAETPVVPGQRRGSRRCSPTAGNCRPMRRRRRPRATVRRFPRFPQTRTTMK